MMNQLPVRQCQYCGGKDIRVGWQSDALVTFKRTVCWATASNS